ncbi:MAG: GAF domain-containing protein [Deltaproteobacteria bacterium]|nr:GAF domain-containing protein [Deltaproteobacteria bacterium]MCF8119314.1 GAF domain-containing protein [Deltaproteobacteria bacterium]
MYDKMTQEELLAKCNELERQVAETAEEASQRTKELSALMKGSKVVLEEKRFIDSARAIFDYCKDLIGATSGYIALLTDDGMENEVLFLESGGLPCDVNPSLPMPIRGLRAEAYQKNLAVYHNDFMHSEWEAYMPAGHVVLHNVMFAPLVLSGKTVGIIGLANKPRDFDDNDARMATGFGELAAIALQNSNNLDERSKAEQEREKVIADLKSALAEVKTLSGLLPICASCKKIRDDTGYWNQIEEYVSKRSEAQFSHSICPECAKILYPDLLLNKE